ncbi:tail protein [Aquamicrobium phage P14]|uniref:Putative tail tubular protein B n=1 Tax=Aquamicrobium phage P14 TaxID=1927013 RepID=A0A1L5C087_9CAUD|nr:tail protein [Aquamicrobium phage P14]APL99497.1 putative tail tubular protein B [Aquamicrobium phage P14]
MKVNGSYTSVVRGVSQQVPQDRYPGQSFEQINFLSDPVRGLARRHGSKRLVEVARSGDHTQFLEDVEDTARTRVYTMDYRGDTYDFIYRPTAAQPGVDAKRNFLFCFGKKVPRHIPVVTQAEDAVATQVAQGGVSAITSVGRYVLVAGQTVRPGYDVETPWANTQRYACVQVRAGAYARTYTVTVTVGGTSFSASYKTMTSAYPGVLDTSDIAYSDPEYSKKVTDRNNAYTTALNQWVADATQDITPQNIADKLRAALITARPSGMPLTIETRGNNIILNHTGGGAVDIKATDSGDGTSIRDTARVVRAVNQVGDFHWVGKVVKVHPTKADASDALYLRAVAVAAGEAGWAEVRWVETAGVIQKPKNVFLMGFIKNDTFYLASTAAILQTISGEGGHPTFANSEAGDEDTVPPPGFIGNRIDYMGLFQDRLMIVSGSTIFMSRTGDYFNWYPSTRVAQDDSDPIEMYALGSEGDVIVSGVTYDRNLTLFGQRFQYVISGRNAITPTNASVVVQSAHENSVDAFPVNSGNLVFFTKYRNRMTTAHQLQIGLVADSPEAYEISRALDTYIKGRPVEIAANTSPDVVVLRTDTQRRSLYVYAYMDTAGNQERLFDSWSRFDYHEEMGALIGVSVHEGSLRLYWLREGRTEAGAYQAAVVCDEQSLESETSETPYLDSWTAHNQSQIVLPSSDTAYGYAFTSNTPQGMLGVTHNRLHELDTYPDKSQLREGYLFESLVTPTNPYMRDRNDKVITTGRLTLGRILVSVNETGGMYADVEVRGTQRTVVNFSGRLTGRSSNRVGVSPVGSTIIPIPIAQDSADCKFTIRSRTWLPLTIVAMEWVGQYFQNSRRV